MIISSKVQVDIKVSMKMGNGNVQKELSYCKVPVIYRCICIITRSFIFILHFDICKQIIFMYTRHSKTHLVHIVTMKHLKKKKSLRSLVEFNLFREDS